MDKILERFGLATECANIKKMEEHKFKPSKNGTKCKQVLKQEIIYYIQTCTNFDYKSNNDELLAYRKNNYKMLGNFGENLTQNYKEHFEDYEELTEYSPPELLLKRLDGDSFERLSKPRIFENYIDKILNEELEKYGICVDVYIFNCDSSKIAAYVVYDKEDNEDTDYIHESFVDYWF